MEGAGEDVELGGDAGLDEALGVFDVFVYEEVQFADDDERRGQARQVLGSGWRRVGRDVVGAGRFAEQGGPSGDVGLAVPRRGVLDVGAGGGDVAVVEVSGR